MTIIPNSLSFVIAFLNRAFKAESSFIVVLILASFLVAFKVLQNHSGWFNTDFTVYYEAARLHSLHRYREAIDIYNWPLYPLLIAFLKVFLGVSIFTAAQILTGFMYCLLSFSLCLLIRELDGDRLTLILGCLILFGSQNLTGHIMPMLIKDVAGLAFFTLAVVHLIRFFKNQTFKSAFYWQALCLISTMFRIEVTVSLALIPLVAFLNKSSFKNRILLYLKLNTLNIMLFVTVFLMRNLFISSRLSDLFLDSYNKLQSLLVIFVADLSSFRKIFSMDCMDSCVEGFLATHLFLILMKMVKAFGWFNAFIMITNRNFLVSIPIDFKRVFYLAIVSSFVVSILTVMSRYGLVTRYLMILNIFGIIFSAVYLRNLIHKASLSSKKILQILYVFIFSVLLALIVINVTRNVDGNVNLESSKWIKKNILGTNNLYINDKRLALMATENFIPYGQDLCDATDSILNSDILTDKDFFVLKYSIKDTLNCSDRFNQLNSQFLMIKEFTSEKNGHHVRIYKRN